MSSPVPPLALTFCDYALDHDVGSQQQDRFHRRGEKDRMVLSPVAYGCHASQVEPAAIARSAPKKIATIQAPATPSIVGWEPTRLRAPSHAYAVVALTVFVAETSGPQLAY